MGGFIDTVGAVVSCAKNVTESRKYKNKRRDKNFRIIKRETTWWRQKIVLFCIVTHIGFDSEPAIEVTETEQNGATN